VVRIFSAWLTIAGILFAFWFRAMPRIKVPPSSDFVAPGPAFLVTHVLLFVVGFLALSSTAVAWHRLILLGERPPAIYLRVGGPVMRYLGRFLLIGLVAAPIMLLCSLLLLPLVDTLIGRPAAPPDLSAPITLPSRGQLLAFSIAGLVVSVPALLVISRLFISLPGIAIGRPMTLSEAWQSTAGNTGKLLLGTLLIYAPSYAIGLAIQLITWPPSVNLLAAQQSGNHLAAMLFFFANFLVGFLVTIAAISFLSLSYRFLIGTAQPAQPEAG
jgi:hypothetical protein